MCVAPIARFCESRYNARPPESPLYKIHFVVSSNANTRSQHTLHHNTTLVVDVEFASAPERHIHTLQLAFLFRHRLRCSRFYINFSLDPRVSFPSSLAHPPTHAHTHTLMAGGGVATEGGGGGARNLHSISPECRTPTPPAPVPYTTYIVPIPHRTVLYNRRQMCDGCVFDVLSANPINNTKENTKKKKQTA